MKRAALLLAGIVLLVAAAALRLPRPYRELRIESNPFRRTLSPFDGRLFAVVGAAAASIPPSARVAVEGRPGRPGDSAYCAMFAAGLLPGRRVRPAEAPSPPRGDWKPQFLIRLGDPGTAPPGRPLARMPEGEVWKLEE